MTDRAISPIISAGIAAQRGRNIVNIRLYAVKLDDNLNIKYNVSFIQKGIKYEYLNYSTFKEAKEVKGKPTAIIAKTIKGKDVSFMENEASWHGAAPNEEQYAVAMADLEKVGEALCQM